MLPEKFYLPWEEIDPELRHGGIEDQLGEGYVGPLLGDNRTTVNLDLLRVFGALRDLTASLASMPGGDVEGHPNRNMIEETLLGMNWFNERVLDRIRPSSNSIFQWTHARPPSETFTLRPIRYPLRNVFLNEVVFTLLGTMVETTESNANGFHSCIDPGSGAKILAPVWHLKANLIRDWFDHEVGGEISAEELTTMFSTIPAPPGPTVVPSGETAPRPTEEEVAPHLEGVSVLQWFPDLGDWQKFQQKRDNLYTPERLHQPEGAMRTTEDVSPDSPVVPQPTTPSGQPI